MCIQINLQISCTLLGLEQKKTYARGGPEQGSNWLAFLGAEKRSDGGNNWKKYLYCLYENQNWL